MIKIIKKTDKTVGVVKKERERESNALKKCVLYCSAKKDGLFGKGKYRKLYGLFQNSLSFLHLLKRTIMLESKDRYA